MTSNENPETRKEKIIRACLTVFAYYMGGVVMQMMVLFPLLVYITHTNASHDTLFFNFQLNNMWSVATIYGVVFFLGLKVWNRLFPHKKWEV